MTRFGVDFTLDRSTMLVASSYAEALYKATTIPGAVALIDYETAVIQDIMHMSPMVENVGGGGFS